MTDVAEPKTRERRTLVVSGRRTTISLEQEVWRTLSDVAERERVPLSFVADEVDRRREDASLASGLRVFCLYYWRILAEARAESVAHNGGNGFSEAADPPGLFECAILQMAKGGRHRARDAPLRSSGRFGKPV